MIEKVDLFDKGGVLRLIEATNETIYIDTYEIDGLPADLSEATAFFHLMEFATREHIWTKKCEPISGPVTDYQNNVYPYIVPIKFQSADTLNLNGHYIGQLELIDYHGESQIPFELEIIVKKNAI